MHRPVFFILAIASSITSIAATTPYGRHRVILDEGERPETLWQADAFEPENVTPMLPKERRDIDPVPNPEGTNPCGTYAETATDGPCGNWYMSMHSTKAFTTPTPTSTATSTATATTTTTSTTLATSTVVVTREGPIAPIPTGT
ncbi:MAG: hypothetical protein LQ346_004250 [Caloplaca aetnensis]|nr:MAG: hypothetical protein LQ346_004250 [Caloplaca aetnensis]